MDRRLAKRPDSRRAIVIGAGMAGLLAARTLADHHDHVVLVEHDKLPTELEDRAGAPQGRHVHALLARGQQILESMFPGLTDELAFAGAPVGDLLERSRLYFSGHRLIPARSGLTAISGSRVLLEHHVRRRVLAVKGVDIVDCSDVVGLLSDSSGRRVTGARLTRRGGGESETIVGADLVIDATGRNGLRTSRLRALGITPPPEDRIPVDVAYATRRYRMSADLVGGDLAIINAPTPGNPRSGVLGLVEGEVGMVTLAGLHGDRPPLDAGGFEAFARSLTSPDIATAIERAQPIDDPVRYRFPASTWRRFDQVDLPEAYAAIGDTVCSLNPIYGQGMTVAALEAEALGRHLTRHGHLRPRRFARETAQVVRPAWQMAAGADLQLPGGREQRTRAQGLLGSYLARLHRAAGRDPELSRVFVRVTGLVDPPAALLRPSVVRRVLRRREPRRRS